MKIAFRNTSTHTITLPHDFNGIELLNTLDLLSAKLLSWKTKTSNGNPRITIRLPDSKLALAHKHFQF